MSCEFHSSNGWWPPPAKAKRHSYLEGEAPAGWYRRSNRPAENGSRANSAGSPWIASHPEACCERQRVVDYWPERLRSANPGRKRIPALSDPAQTSQDPAEADRYGSECQTEAESGCLLKSPDFVRCESKPASAEPPSRE